MLDSLTLDQLRILVTVAEEGSFSAAGRRLRRVQSAISQSIQGLEQVLSVSLFDRTTKTPSLTDAGRALVSQARQVLIQADALKAQAADISTGVEPTLTLAVDCLFPSQPLVQCLQALAERFPNLPVTLYTDVINASERRLRDGTAQIALYGALMGTGGDLVIEGLASIAMAPVVAARHPLAAAGGPIARRALEPYIQLILTDPLAGENAPSFGVISSRVWRFVDLTRRLDFLRAGFGWGNMPLHMVQPLIETGELVRLQLDEPSLALDRFPVHAVYRRGAPPGVAGRWLLDRLKEACRT